MDILSINNLSKSFRQQQVLRDISFTVKQGEVIAVIGPSGSGKTTLLRCAAMLENADGGSIDLGGISVVESGKYADKASLKSARTKCGMVFQNFNLFPHMLVLDNIIDAPVHVLGIPRQEAVREALELLGKWRCRSMSMLIHVNYPAVSSSALRSPERWHCIRKYSFSTNRHRHWIRS